MVGRPPRIPAPGSGAPQARHRQAPHRSGGLLTPILVRMLDARVGSTALMRLLASSAEIAMDRDYPYHNSFLTYFARLSRQISHPVPSDPAVLSFVYNVDATVEPLPFETGLIEPAELGRRALRAIWSEFSELVAGESSAAPSFYAEKFWGELDPILDAGLVPVVIDMVRDPRDIVASMRAFNARHEGRLFGRPEAKDDDDHFRRTVLGIGLRFAELDRTASPGLRRMVVRYEDFIRDVGGHAAALGELIGTRLDPQVLAEGDEQQRRHATAETVEATIGRWRRDLMPVEAAYVERRLRSLMGRLGYLAR